MAFNATQIKRLKEAVGAQQLLNSICSDGDLIAAVRPVANTVAALNVRLSQAQASANKSPINWESTPVNMRTMVWSIVLPGPEDEFGSPTIKIDWSDPLAFGCDSMGSFSFPLAILVDDAAFVAYVQNFEAEIRGVEDAMYEAQVAAQLARLNAARAAKGAKGTPKPPPQATAPQPKGGASGD